MRRRQIRHTLLPQKPTIQLLHIHRPVAISSRRLLRMMRPPQDDLLRRSRVDLKDGSITRSKLSALNPIRLTNPTYLFTSIMNHRHSNKALLYNTNKLHTRRSHTCRHGQHTNNHRRSLRQLTPILARRHRHENTTRTHSSAFQSPHEINEPQDQPETGTSSLP